MFAGHLNSDMETKRNHSIMKKIEQIQSFQKNTGDLKNSKRNLNHNFIFQKGVDQQKEQVITIVL